MDSFIASSWSSLRSIWSKRYSMNCFAVLLKQGKLSSTFRTSQILIDLLSLPDSLTIWQNCHCATHYWLGFFPLKVSKHESKTLCQDTILAIWRASHSKSYGRRTPQHISFLSQTSVFLSLPPNKSWPQMWKRRTEVSWEVACENKSNLIDEKFL